MSGELKRIGYILTMEKIEFKKLFGEIAKANGYIFQYGVWWKESPASISLLELQKSNFGNFYYLEIKVFVNGIVQEKHKITKSLVKAQTYCCFTRPSSQYTDCLDLDILMDTTKRKQCLELLFSGFVKPFSDKALTSEGIYELINEKRVLCAPSTKLELEKLMRKEVG